MFMTMINRGQKTCWLNTFYFEKQIKFSLSHLMICLLKKYQKNVSSFIIPETKSDPKRNSVLTRSVLIDMFPKKFSTLVYEKKVSTFYWTKIYKLLSWELIVLDQGKNFKDRMICIQLPCWFWVLRCGIWQNIASRSAFLEAHQLKHRIIGQASAYVLEMS